MRKLRCAAPAPQSRLIPPMSAIPSMPGSLEDVYLQALARLPEMSVILYPDPQDDERGIYLPVEPCDPFTEAVRTGLEVDAEVIFTVTRA